MNFGWFSVRFCTLSNGKYILKQVYFSRPACFGRNGDIQRGALRDAGCLRLMIMQGLTAFVARWKVGNPGTLKMPMFRAVGPNIEWGEKHVKSRVYRD